MRSNRLASALVLAAGLLVPATSARALESSPLTLGSDGTAYRLWSGTFQELFGANAALPSATPVAALDVVAPGQPFARYVVPGTEGAVVESSPVLVYDGSSNAVHLLWNASDAGPQGASRLLLRTFDSSGWSAPTEVSGGTPTAKSNVEATLVNDAYLSRIDGESTRIRRRTLHVVWSEQTGTGYRSFYTPVVFVDGRYVGWNPVVALDDLAPGDPEPGLVAPADLAARPHLLVAPSGKATAVFVHSVTQRLSSVEIALLPGELGELAEAARGHIVELAGPGGAGSRPQLAEMARGHIVELAENFHTAAAAYLGERTGQLLLDAPAEADATTLAEMARGHIVELGREILDGGLSNPTAAEGFVLRVAALEPRPGNDFAHLISLRRVATWDVPTGPPSGSRLMVSPAGDRVIFGWETAGQILYREARVAGEWGELLTLSLESLGSEQGWAALERRAAGN